MMKSMERGAQPIKRRRTEQERLRRHLYGDKGATFSKCKESYIGSDEVLGTITSVYSIENYVCEIWYED
jgi:hypothetical protein